MAEPLTVDARVKYLEAENRELRQVLYDLVKLTEECIDAGYRPADIPIMLDWPPLPRARQLALAAQLSTLSAGGES
jgi:hypothetical protein